MPNDAAAVTAAEKVIPEITGWPYEFPLSRPLQTADDLTQVLVLKEPTAADAFKFHLLDGLHSSQIRDLVASLAVTPPNFIDKISAADMIALTVRLNRFFSRAAA